MNGARNPEPLEYRPQKRARNLIPHLGRVPLAKRITRPESYRQAVAEMRDTPKWHRIHSHLAQYSERNGQFFFVQIGANDGIRNDPIRQHVIKYGWQGLLVEPVPHVFRSLKHNYAGQDRLSFANVAVDSHSGRATMLTAKELAAGANNPMSSMSSFHEDVVKKHEWLVESLDGLVEEQQVPTVTLRSLLNDYAINRIDGLFVDTEGHDKVVLDQLNLATHKPQFILYEHVHLSRTDQATLIGRFEENGYSITAMRRDTFAELPLE